MSLAHDYVVSGFLFDLDGVLVDSRGMYRSAWSSWAAAHGVDEALIWADAHGRRPEDIINRVAPALVLADALAAFDRCFHAATNARCDPLPGAVESLTSLPPDSWAIVTSGRRNHVMQCLRTSALPRPTVLVCGDEIRRGKPDPEGFLLAARRLGVSPAACIVVEDAPVGIQAARAAGMTAIAVSTTHDVADLGASDLVFPSLREATPELLAHLPADTRASVGDS
jgi:sugar-phosphatase